MAKNPKRFRKWDRRSLRAMARRGPGGAVGRELTIQTEVGREILPMPNAETRAAMREAEALVAARRARWEKAGWTVGTTQSFLGLTDGEMAEIDEKLIRMHPHLRGPLPKILAVEPLPDFHLLLTFLGGEVRSFDFTPWLQRVPFQHLADPVLFGQVQIKEGTVWWPGDYGFDPLRLWDESVPVSRGMRLKTPGPLPDPIKLLGDGHEASDQILQDRDDPPQDPGLRS